MKTKKVWSEVIKDSSSSSKTNKTSLKYFNKENVLDILDDNFRKINFNVTKFASEFNFTAPYFWEKCNILFGENPKVLIDRKRVDNIKMLLLEYKELSLAKIVRNSGFANLNTLRKVFKRVEGVNPQVFREQF